MGTDELQLFLDFLNRYQSMCEEGSEEYRASLVILADIRRGLEFARSAERVRKH